MRNTHACRLIATLVLCAPSMHAQNAPAPDVVTFADGEKLVGQFERSNGDTFAFKSDILGEITVPWSKVQEFQSSKQLAVIPKNVRLRRKEETAGVPQGIVTVAAPNLTVTPASGTPQTVAIADIDHVLEQPVFTKAMETAPGFLSEWAGTATAGASFVQATQKNETFTGAINLVRTDPSEDWLRKQSRTIVGFTESYGTISEPREPTLKTSIFHGLLERDEYLSPGFFLFGQALEDHNFSQGLALQQTYGGGAGWSLIRRDPETLDLKAGLAYIHQDFLNSQPTQDLIASAFEEDFRRSLPRGVLFAEQIVLTPSWNNTRAYSATGDVALTLPVYRRLGSTVQLLESFLHDPPPGFKKNSFQVTFGLTYSLR